MRKWHVMTMLNESKKVLEALDTLTQAGVEMSCIKIDGGNIYYYHEQQIFVM